MFQHTDKNLISSPFEEAICDEQKLVLHVRKSTERLVLIYIKRQPRKMHIYYYYYYYYYFSHSLTASITCLETSEHSMKHDDKNC